MLSTPGRSPRQLPPPSPWQSILRDDSVGAPSQRQKRQRMSNEPVVLDEDSYVDAIEHIVQRDYFPDIPRLQDRLEWLEAIRTGDPEVIRQAQIHIMQRRAKRRGSVGVAGHASASGTPSTVGGTPRSIAGTPGGVGSLPTPCSTGTPGKGFRLGQSDVADEEEESAREERSKMTLDEFLRIHTSEDNASFNQLKEKENRKRREKAATMYFLEGVPRSGEGDTRSKDLALVAQPGQKLLQDGSGELRNEDRKTDGYGTSGQPVSSLQLWPYKARNELMYDSSHREVVPFTKEEVTERAMGPPKQVKYRNTRFRQAELSEQNGRASNVEDKVAILYNPLPGETPQRHVDPTGEGGSHQHYDLEDFRRTPRSTAAASAASGGAVPSVGTDGKERAYEYVSTPSFTPGVGVDASPLMTWGEIEGTPLRLEAEDTPVGIGGSADGPHFKIPTSSKRDHAAMAISRAAAKSIKARRQRMQGGGGTPGASLFLSSPAHSKLGMSSPLGGSGGIGLSPAAQKLASQAAKGKRGGGKFDASLRASYTASPLRSPVLGSRLGSSRKVSSGAHRTSSITGTPVQRGE